MEISPGIHLLTDRIDATTLTVTLIGDDEAGLIVDTGLPATAATVVLPALDRLGRPPAWLRTIVHTHCHADHVAGNTTLLAVTDARVLIHRAEAGYLADPLAFASMMRERYGDGGAPPDPLVVRRQYGPGTPVDAALEDGDIILVAGREWRVVHTPGHSPGGVCLYEAATGTLITGDALQAEGTTSCDLAFYFEAADYERTLDVVEALAVETVIAGHPFKPFATAHLTGREARRFLQVSRAAYERYGQQVAEILAAAPRALTTGEVAERLTTRNDFTRVVGPAIQTTRAHLEHLRRQDRATRVYTDGGWRWRAGPPA
jgi:glyoxylase-like metal-dependent hydrolase (beta-lactamase superfamily II)